jgi:multiple sugar transport system substrate-binding protein
MFMSVLMISGCGKQEPLDPKTPVTLTMWHNFGGDMQQSMDALIDEFNATVGKEEGVIISVEAISSSAELQDALGMILNEDPGAPEMPDITTAYPKTAVQFQKEGLLADLSAYFTEEELTAYIPAFVDEGRLEDGLYVFPFAKSTEILFVNQTIFDRFASETGVTMDCFATFEGVAVAAEAYYKWTDEKTPDVQNDGKQFYNADSWFNLAQAGMLQQGGSLFDGETFALENDYYKKIWDTCYTPSAAGGFAIFDGYSSDLSKTGDIVCSTGSSAGVLFYGDTVTFADGTSEKAEYTILPFPVFEGGEKIAVQRGGGLMVSKGDETREYASALFIKWFTQPEHNMRFVSETGYLPVTEEAFETYMPQTIESAENPHVRQMLRVVTDMNAEYAFFVAPAFEAFDSLSKEYEQQYKALMAEQRETRIAKNGEVDPEGALNRFIAEINK